MHSTSEGIHETPKERNLRKNRERMRQLRALERQNLVESQKALECLLQQSKDITCAQKEPESSEEIQARLVILNKNNNLKKIQFQNLNNVIFVNII